MSELMLDQTHHFTFYYSLLLGRKTRCVFLYSIGLIHNGGWFLQTSYWCTGACVEAWTWDIERLWSCRVTSSLADRRFFALALMPNCTDLKLAKFSYHNWTPSKRRICRFRIISSHQSWDTDKPIPKSLT